MWGNPETKTELERIYNSNYIGQWGAGNVYLIVLSSWKVNIDENPIDSSVERKTPNRDSKERESFQRQRN